MAHTRNKMKHWRKLGNKIVIDVPKLKTETNADGVETRVTDGTDQHRLTGRQLKSYTQNWGSVKTPTGLLKDLLSRAGCSIIDVDEVVVSVPEPEGV